MWNKNAGPWNLSEVGKWRQEKREMVSDTVEELRQWEFLSKWAGRLGGHQRGFKEAACLKEERQGTVWKWQVGNLLYPLALRSLKCQGKSKAASTSEDCSGDGVLRDSQVHLLPSSEGNIQRRGRGYKDIWWRKIWSCKGTLEEFGKERERGLIRLAVDSGYWDSIHCWWSIHVGWSRRLILLVTEAHRNIRCKEKSA